MIDERHADEGWTKQAEDYRPGKGPDLQYVQ